MMTPSLRLPAASAAAAALAVLAASSASAVATSTAVAARGAAACPAPSHDPSTLVAAVDAFQPDFDPASFFTAAEALVDRPIYEGLVRMKGASATQVEPSLAASWSSAKGGRVWTFHLRSNARFSDGSKLTAQGVKAAYTRTLTLGVGAGSTLGSFITSPKQIVAVNPTTVRFDLPHAATHFDLVLASTYGVGIANPKVFTQHSKGPKDQGHAWLQSHAAGTGPYMLKSLQPGDQLVLTRNPYYWGGWKGKHFKQIIIREVPEIATRRQLVESGDVDTAFAIEASPEDITAVDKNPCLRAGHFKNLNEYYIELGAYGPLKSAKARQALNYAFPASEFISTVEKGLMVPAHGVFPDLLVGHDRGAYSFPFDLNKAKQLLQQAGVKSGTKLTYEYYTGEGGREPGLVLQQQLGKIGIKLQLIEKAYPAFLADLTTNRPVAKRANMYYWFWWPEYNHPSDYAYPILSGHSTPAKCPCFNSGYYVDPTVDKIIDAGFTQSNDAKLAAAMRTAQKIMNKTDPPWIPVGQQLENTFFRTDIKGQVFSPLYIDTWDFYALHRG